MNPEDAARQLIRARERRQQITLAGVRSFEDAYEIQDAFARLWSRRPGGHKVGCSSAESQRLVGSPGPIAGRLFTDDIRHSPATVTASEFFLVGVEAEFGFRLRRALPPRELPYSLDDVTDAVGSLVPLIEICDTRLADWESKGIEEITADNAFHGGIVLGREVAEWRDIDLLRHEVTLAIDGEVRGRGTGALVLGHPLQALVWLANSLSTRGIGIAAGELVAAGTCTGLHFASAGHAVRADFGTLGTVEMRVTR
jgi:2-keto-4-pentenoate hydratase